MSINIDQDKTVADYLRILRQEQFFGEIIIKFREGRIYHVDRNESMRLENITRKQREGEIASGIRIK